MSEDTTIPETQITLNVQKKFGASLIDVPVGPSGVQIYVVPVGKTLVITDFTLWVDAASNPTPTTWLMERGLNGQPTNSEYIWQFRGVSQNDQPFRSWNMVRGFTFQAGSEVEIRTAGSASGVPRIGYTILGHLR